MSSHISFDYSKYDFKDPVSYEVLLEPGLSEEVVRAISQYKREPEWMTRFRLRAYEVFRKKPLPTWGADLSRLDFDRIRYYARPTDAKATSWDEVPEYIKRTFEKLGIPEAERKFLAGVGAQYESEVVYHRIREDLERMGVIFLDMDTALQKYPDIVKRYFGTVIPPEDNKFAALNSAVWSGGSFVYVPRGVQVEMPLQAYFRINAPNIGQFERTLIIAEPYSKVHYIEGCTAPIYSRESLHSAVVEIIAMEGAHVRYTTLQNWSKDVYNLVTKRAVAHRNAFVEWVDANVGCLTPDTKVFTNQDVREIKDLKVGDYVYSIGPDLRVVRARVVAKVVNPPRMVYRLVTANHREVKATDNHPFLALERRGRYLVVRWKALREIRPGELIAVVGRVPDNGRPLRITFRCPPRAAPIRVPGESDEGLLWLIGFYLRAGRMDGSRVRFAVAKGDPALPRLLGILRDLLGVEPKRSGSFVTVDSSGLVAFLRSLGLTGSARRRVPRWVYGLPEAQRRALIEGYAAADGEAGGLPQGPRRLRGSRRLLEDLKALAMTCGLNPLRISRWTGGTRRTGAHARYVLRFSDVLPSSEVYFVPVVKVEALGMAETYDIEVEQTGNFIAEGVVVHNSRATMKYPSVYMIGPGARAEILSVAFAGREQHQDAGAKAVHLAPNTTSRITSKSVSKDGGRTTYRGLVHVAKGATGVKSSVRCDALLLDGISRTDTYPYMEIYESDATVTHEATVGKVGEDQLFYLMSRGLTEAEALNLVVMGFLEPFTKTLPMEYAVEFNRLIELEMSGAVG